MSLFLLEVGWNASISKWDFIFYETCFEKSACRLKEIILSDVFIFFYRCLHLLSVAYGEG